MGADEGGPQPQIQDGGKEVQVARPRCHPPAHAQRGIEVDEETDTRKQQRADDNEEQKGATRPQMGGGAIHQADDQQEDQEVHDPFVHPVELGE